MASTGSELKGKVLQQGVRRGETALGKPYAFGWVQVIESSLREIVEVTSDLTREHGEIDSPFAQLNRGQFVTLPVGNLRTYGGMLTGSMVVSEEAADDAESQQRSEEAPF